MKKIALLAVVSILSGCATTGANLHSNEHGAEQVKAVQETRKIKIISISPANIQVNNDNVEGVSIGYLERGKIFSSEQVGKVCEYHLGASILIATFPFETRIQPNASCPAEK